jgi:sugar lactone lactonase YvrE
MSLSGRIGWKSVVASVAAIGMSGALVAQGRGQATPSKPRPRVTNIMNNPYRMVENWPQLGNIKPGAAIGHVPDGKGGLWLQHRSEPPILRIDASGKVVQSFGNGMFTADAHGLCMDRDGNLWAGDSGRAGPPERGSVYYKFSPEGKLLLTIGKPGVRKASQETFIAPTNCAIHPTTGNIVIADGHIPRPDYGQLDGDRIVEFTTSGKFVREFGRKGTGPGEFYGPHAVAFDSQGRLFVADRSNNRIQVFDRDYKFLDDWKQFGRPSGVWILKDDTMFVADSESGYLGFIPTEEKQMVPIRNAGWKTGVWVGSAKDGSIRSFIANTNPEGLSADEMGNIFAGLTGGCDLNSAGNCLQKWVRQGGAGSR